MHVPMNRAADIERTAEAIQARREYLAFCVRRDTPKRWKVLHCANASDMSSDAFRQLFTFLAYAKADLTDASPSHKTVGFVTGRCERTSKSATKELQDGGWLDTKRTRREEAIRKITIPQCILDAIPEAAIDTKCRSAKSDTSKNQEVQKRASRSAKSDTSTFLEVQKTTLRSAEFCPQTIYNQDPPAPDKSAHGARTAKSDTLKKLTPEDTALYLDAINAFCRDPRNLATLGQPVISPEDAGRDLDGWVQGWARQAPLETVLSCLPGVLTEMAIRGRDPSLIRRGQRTLSGFASYLRKFMETVLSEATAPPKAVNGTHANGHAASNGAIPPLTRAQRMRAVVEQRKAQRQKEGIQ